jgi:molybdopterin molybdotransferase
MNAPDLTVTRRPVVALIATGDELVLPGEVPRAIRSWPPTPTG